MDLALLTVGLGLLGLVLGRFLLLVFPILIYGIWRIVHGPISADDDVTQIASGLFLYLALGALTIGVVANRFVRFLMQRIRARSLHADSS